MLGKTSELHCLYLSSIFFSLCSQCHPQVIFWGLTGYPSLVMGRAILSIVAALAMLPPSTPLDVIAEYWTDMQSGQFLSNLSSLCDDNFCSWLQKVLNLGLRHHYFRTPTARPPPLRLTENVPAVMRPLTINLVKSFKHTFTTPENTNPNPRLCLLLWC